MKPVLEYKGYFGSAELSIEDNILFGKLLYINDVVSYTATSPKELQAAFHAAVDDYLDTCAECGDTPDVPFKGVFNVRLGPELHKACALNAERSGMKLNEWVKNACQAHLNRTAVIDHPKQMKKVVFVSSNTHFLSSQDNYDIQMEAGDWAKAAPATVQ